MFTPWLGEYHGELGTLWQVTEMQYMDIWRLSANNTPSSRVCFEEISGQYLPMVTVSLLCEKVSSTNFMKKKVLVNCLGQFGPWTEWLTEAIEIYLSHFWRLEVQDQRTSIVRLL